MSGKNIQALVAIELAKRGHGAALDALTPEQLAGLSTEDLIAIQRVGVPGTPSAKRGSGTRESVLGAVRRHRAAITVREAVLRACSAAALTSAEIIAALERTRPGTPSPTVRAEIKRLLDAGALVHAGPDIGGTFRTAAKHRT